MRLSKALKEKLMDVRLRDKLINQGKVTPAQINEYMQSLPDDAERAVAMGKEGDEYSALTE